MLRLLAQGLDLSAIGPNPRDDVAGGSTIFDNLANFSLEDMTTQFDDLGETSSPPSLSAWRWMSVVVLDIGFRELLFFATMLLFIHAYLTLIRRLCPLPPGTNRESELYRYYEDQNRQRLASTTFLGLFENTQNGSPTGLTSKQIEDASATFVIDFSKDKDCSRKCEGKNLPGSTCVIDFGQDLCAICLEELHCSEREGRLRRLQCEHVYHQGKFVSSSKL